MRMTSWFWWRWTHWGTLEEKRESYIKKVLIPRKQKVLDVLSALPASWELIEAKAELESAFSRLKKGLEEEQCKHQSKKQ